MALPTLSDGDTVYANDWNKHVAAINTNTDDIAANASAISSNDSDIAALDSRLDTIEAPNPKCILGKSASQSILGGGDRLVTWDVTETNVGNMKQGDTIVIPEDGDYLVSGLLNMASLSSGSTAGECIIYISKGDGFIGDVAIAAFGQPEKVGGGLGNGLSTAVVGRFAQGDVLRVWAFSSADRTLRAANFGGCTFAVIKQR